MTAALALIYLQLSFFLPDLTRTAGPAVSGIIPTALILGISFGLTGCPGCSLPLGLSLIAYDARARRALLPVILFNVSRITTLFIWAMAANAGFGLLRTVSASALFTASGIIMIIFAGLILKGFSLTLPPGVSNPAGKNLWLGYLTWGGLLGIPCSFEATGFLAQLLAQRAAAHLKITALLVFAVSTSLPVIVLSLLVYAGISNVYRRFQDMRKPIRVFAALYLSLMGLLFILSQYLP
jgi:cytochrome c biogenesis protein CcdA